jgi:hypothetical protein
MNIIHIQPRPMWLFRLAAGLRWRGLLRRVRVDIYRNDVLVETRRADDMLPPWM